MRIVDRGMIFDATAAPREARFCTFTSLNSLARGRLLAAFRVGSAKDSPDEDVRIMASDDAGATWQQVFGGFGDVPPNSGGRVRSIGLTELPSGKLLASIITVDHSDPTLPMASPETQGLLPTHIYIVESGDGGQTWSTPREVDLTPHTGNAITGDLMQLKNGALALPYEAWKGYYDTSLGEHHAALRLSTDGGQSWGGPIIVAHDDANHVLYWDQRLTVTPDGRLFGVFWSHDRSVGEDLPMHTATGSPDGMTWSAPRSMGMGGQIAGPLGLGGDRLFVAYVHRHHPPSLRAVLSDDLGASWRVEEELVFYEKQLAKGAESGMNGPRDFGDYWADMGIWTFGHPAPARLPNGDVMVAYYAGDAAAMSIHWVQIALD